MKFNTLKKGLIIRKPANISEMPRTYSYVVLVDGKTVYRGKNPKRILKEAKKKYPGKKISIRYEYPEEILIAIIRL